MDIIELEINGDRIVFTDDAHFSTDSKKLVKAIGENLDKTIYSDKGVFVSSIDGWGIFFLAGLIDPDFKVISLDEMVDIDTVEQVREVIKNQ